MTDEAQADPQETASSSRLPLLIGLVAALVMGGAGFYAVQSGLILAPAADGEEHAAPEGNDQPMADVAFVPIEPLVINVGGDGEDRHLRFRAQLEVWREAEPEVVRVLPRVVDVLNGYLRAVETSELEERTALVRLRSQMLRRVRVVAGQNRVRDLLIMEFVLN